MSISEFINQFNPKHKAAAKAIMQIISEKEPSLEPQIKTTMGKEMICYEQNGEFKYAIASHPQHLSLHNMVMYCYPDLNDKFVNQFTKAKFRKGCINFTNVDDFPINTIEQLILESSNLQYPTEQQLK